MKTREANNSLSGKKLAIYVACIAAFCFLNCLCMNARDYDSNPFNKRVTIEEPTLEDPRQNVARQDWLTNFHYEMLTIIIRNRVLNTYYQKYQSGQASGPKSQSPAARHGKGPQKVNKFRNALDIQL
jgi:hypothetical protein